MSKKSDRLSNFILLLCAILAAFVGTVLALGGKSGSAMGLCILFLLAVTLGAGILLVRHPLFPGAFELLCALTGLYLALCLRLSLFDHISGDYVSFLSHWLDTMRGMTIRQALSTPIGDYNMPYLYLLLVISRLPFNDLYAIKLVSVLFDALLALAVGRLAGLLTRRPTVILLAFLAALLAPTGFLNSGYWGQCDSIYAALALWGLYYGLRRRPALSLALFAFAFSVKLQAIFLLPILAFLLVRGDIKPRHLWVFPAAFVGVMLPSLLAGRSFSDTFGIYLSQTRSYPYLSLNAPSFWSLVPNEYFDSLDPAPVLLAGGVILVLIVLTLPRASRLSDGDLVTVGLIFSLAMPWLLPKMHERYFYLAEMLSILYAARYPRRLPVAAVLLGGGFLAYCSYLFGGMPILSTQLVAAAYGVTLLYLVAAFLRDTGDQDAIPS